MFSPVPFRAVGEGSSSSERQDGLPQVSILLSGPVGLSQALATAPEHLYGEGAPGSCLPMLFITVPTGGSPLCDLKMSKRRSKRQSGESSRAIPDKGASQCTSLGLGLPICNIGLVTPIDLMGLWRALNNIRAR